LNNAGVTEWSTAAELVGAEMATPRRAVMERMRSFIVYVDGLRRCCWK